MLVCRGVETGERRSRTRWVAVALLSFAILALTAAPARAQGLSEVGLGGLPTTILPPNPLNSSNTVSLGFDDCPAGEATCPARVILEMYERWRPLNARCDHNAVFALTYLRTTEEFARAITGTPGFFEDGSWVNHEDVVFAQLYFRAFDAALAGGQIPVSWQVAFGAASSPDVTGIGDLLLGMNAHINRDLSYTLAAVGLVKPDGGSRKTDHDKVNEFLARIADPLQAELAARYDPLFGTTDTPTPLDEGTILEAVRGFREQAWRNAEPYVNAPDEGSRALAAASTESQSQAYANSILAANTIPGYGPARDAYCRAHLKPSFEVGVLDRELGPVVRDRSLSLRVTTDGPARVTLGAGLLAHQRDGETKVRRKKKARGKGGKKAEVATAAKRGKKGKKKRRKRKRKKQGSGPVALAEGISFETVRAGEHTVTIPLTQAAVGALANSRSADVVVTLNAPGAISTRATGTLTGQPQEGKKAKRKKGKRKKGKRKRGNRHE